MPKFYIQSEKITYVICAADAEGAALWAMHRVMDSKICDYEDAVAEGLIQPLNIPAEEQAIQGIPQAIPYEAMLNGLSAFDATISVSERGFGHTDAGSLETESIFHQWRQLMQAVDRLHDRLN